MLVTVNTDNTHGWRGYRLQQRTHYCQFPKLIKLSILF